MPQKTLPHWYFVHQNTQVFFVSTVELVLQSGQYFAKVATTRPSLNTKRIFDGTRKVWWLPRKLMARRSEDSRRILETLMRPPWSLRRICRYIQPTPWRHWICKLPHQLYRQYCPPGVERTIRSQTSDKNFYSRWKLPGCYKKKAMNKEYQSGSA